jgi:hypothetical protein
MEGKIMELQEKNLSSSEDSLIVQGTVWWSTQKQKPVPGALVRAFDKDMRHKQLLGETTTDEQGAYRIPYTRALFRRSEKQRADLVVRVYMPQAPRLLLAESDLLVNAERHETVDLVASQRYSRYEVEMAVLDRLREKVPVAELTQADVTFLARETNVPPSRVERLVDAARMAQSTDLEPAVFYGLISQDLPTNRSELLDMPMDTLREALVKSLDENLIPARLRQELDAIMESLQQLAATDMGIRAKRQKAVLDRLGTIAGLVPDKQAIVREKIYHPARLTDKNLRELVEAGELEDAEARELGLAISLYRLCDDQADLAGALKNHQFAHLDGKPIKHFTDLIPLEEHEWADVLKAANVTLPNNATTDEYAHGLSKRIARLFPSATLLARVIPRPEVVTELHRNLEQLQQHFGQELRFSNGAAGLPEPGGVDDGQLEALRRGHEKLLRFANTHPGLRLHECLEDEDLSADSKMQELEARVSLLKRMQEQNPTIEFLNLDYTLDSEDVANLKFDGLTAEQQRMVLANWKAYQRGYSITKDIDHTRTLMACGYHTTAGSIVRDGFKALKEKTGFDDSVAHGVLESAHKIHEASIGSLFIAIDEQPTQFAAIPVANSSPDATEYLRRIDGYETIFGNLDYCDCQHCRSIFGPAAYFVDLMQYVEKNLLEKTENLKGHHLDLETRRPDLWKLPLTCENTNRLIPYLDIINEVLENYIAQVSEDIDDDVDNVEDAVYKQAFYEDKHTEDTPKNIHSFRQPFLLPLEELAIYLSHFDTTRAGVAELLGREEEKIAEATLGFSALEYKLVVRADTSKDFLNDLYNITFAGPDTEGLNFYDPDLEPGEDDYEKSRKDVQLLLKPIGVTRAELGELVTTSFVLSNSLLCAEEAAKEIQIKGEKRDDDEDTGSVQNDIERIHGLTWTHLDRLHRFVRLWRHVPWSIRELDLVLYHLTETGAGTGVHPDTLSSIAKLFHLQRRFNLSVEALCALCCEIPQTPVTDGQLPLFDRLFNIPPFVQLDGDFPDPGRLFTHPALLSEPTGDSEGHTLNRLLAGLRVSDEVLYQLVKELAPPLGLDLSTDDRSFSPATKELSLLYRHARLVEYLQLSVLELFQLIKLTPLITKDYVNSLDSLVALLEFHDWWQDTGFSLDDLGYITGGKVLREDAFLEPHTICKKLIADVRADSALQFADTVFTFLDGVTEDKSRAIIQLNKVNEDSADGLFEAVTGTVYRVASDFAVYCSPLVLPEELEEMEEQIRDCLRTHRDSDFTGTVFTIAGISDEQSRAIFDDNPDAFIKNDDTTYHLADDFAIDQSRLNVPPSVTAAIPDPEETEAQIRELMASLVAPGAHHFVDTVFAAIPGIAEEQSRAIFADNNNVFEPVTLDHIYWLKSDIDPDKLAVDLKIPAGTPAFRRDAAQLIAAYHINQIIPTYLARQLKMPVEKVAALIGLTNIDLSKDLNIAALRSGHLSETSALVNLVEQVLRLGILFKDEVYDASAINYIRDHHEQLGLDGFDPIDVAEIQTLSVYCSFAKANDEETWADTLHEVLDAFDEAAGDEATGFDGADPQLLATIMQAELSLVKTLLFDLPARSLEALDILRRRVEAAQYLGVGGTALSQLVSENYDDLASASRAILGAFRAKYPNEAQWEEKFEPFADKIRTKKRDALVDYLLHHPDLHYRNARDLYQHFLLDVELEGCARTSRLVAAISSLQLYVHRCRMHLEQSADGDIDVMFEKHDRDFEGRAAQEEWPWRKYYRLWEANRKVFLYPENYLEPDLRDNKTPLFEELESQLLQGEISEQAVLDAYMTYLRGFEEIARLQIAGAYHDLEKDPDILHLFGVTREDPIVYYYRTVEGISKHERDSTFKTIWRPWRKIDVQIPVKKVAPIVFQGRLYVFWVRIVTSAENDLEEGSSRFVGYKHKMTLEYSALRPDNTWTPPQAICLKGQQPFDDEGVIKDLLREGSFEITDSGDLRIIGVIPKYGIKDDIHADQVIEHRSTTLPWERNIKVSEDFDEFPEDLFDDLKIDGLKAIAQGLMDYDIVTFESKDSYTLSGFLWDQVYPGKSKVGSLVITGANFEMNSPVNFHEKYIGSYARNCESLELQTLFSIIKTDDENGGLCYGQPEVRYFTWLTKYALASLLLDSDRVKASSFAGDIGVDHYTPYFDHGPILTLNDTNKLSVVNGSYAVCIDSEGDLFLLKPTFWWSYPVLIRLGTTLCDELVKTLFAGGVDDLLDTEFQATLKEDEPLFWRSDLEYEYDDLLTFYLDAVDGVDFTGSLGVYFREIFHHIPFLIANHLNSQQQFAAAQKWYHYIFNPTASEVIDEDSGLRPEDRNWRYIEFRKTSKDSLRELLTEAQAIETYEGEPFNPHAIARQRLSLGPYKRAVVMKYIDNLLEWGDHLFAQDTMESINEATMLYVLAADLLGERPAEVGDCGEVPAEELTYKEIKRQLGNDTAEFLMEMEHFVARDSTATSTHPLWRALPQDFTDDDDDDVRADGDSVYVPAFFPAKVVDEVQTEVEITPELTRGKLPLDGLVAQIGPAFCIPANKELLSYWDRVQDRLYKIRNCMNISGVRRELALFAPEIDPMLLVRARAAGLLLDDVLDTISGELPPYRFLFLIERAKSYAATLASFGSALLSALEKKDNEELSCLRVTHQQNILKLTKQIRLWEYNAAVGAQEALERRQITTEYRREYYQRLASERISPPEWVQEKAYRILSMHRMRQAALGILASGFHLIPEFGSPFSLKYGGKQTGDSLSALFSAEGALAAIAENIAALAGFEAHIQRRKENWEFQSAVAELEMEEIKKQLEVARIRTDIAKYSLQILHKTTMEQAEEIWEFYSDKFTNLGLYTWLSQELKELYRQAYGHAYAMAKLAERAFRFERGDETGPWLASNYWEASRAGLLAGERLLMDLQNLERCFIETNYRSLEIDQAFSLTQVAPAALLALKAGGECIFDIPELFFDLFYPGHYKRRIKAVRLTIPCVTGPYTNVSASLELVESYIRDKPVKEAHCKLVPRSRSISIATTTAQNDAGVFELNFRDERYMPFEGAGAISRWKLSLPKNFRPFDYETINDVILHISYTAEADSNWRDQVEGQTAEVESEIRELLASGLQRVFSLRQEFSSQFGQLLHKTSGHTVTIEITDKHFPIFLKGQIDSLTISKAYLVLGMSKKLVEESGVGSFSIQCHTVSEDHEANFEIDYRDSSLHDFGGLLASELTQLANTSIVATYQLSISNVGDVLTPTEGVVGGEPIIDSEKLTDIYLYMEYRLSSS